MFCRKHRSRKRKLRTRKQSSAPNHSVAVLGPNCQFASNALMELTYKILGGDGNQYGPVTAEQFRAWAKEGRVGGDTQVLRSDAPAWVAAALLPELNVTAPAVTTA